MLTHILRPPKLTLVDQPVYWARFGGASLLDPIRPFFNAPGYRWHPFASPGSAREAVAARQTVEDHVSIAPGSFLTMISAESSAFPADFLFEIFDKGSGHRLSSQMLGYMAGAGGPDNAKFAGRPLPFIVPTPLAVTDPGIVQVRITNLSSATNNICLLMHFAERLS